MKNIRPIAVYLPQFHPIPENNEWWGTGFTEWSNVVKSKPRFEGHYQPHLPADLGFYDLRLPEVRQAQADLAKQYGIYGFCYYHYWFNGRRILERPFKEVFESGKPDFPFMLCWANENWTRIWDGSNNDILLEQKYSYEDDVKHINQLIPYFKDNRYIKVDGKPVFIIYKDALLPDVNKTIKTFREECAKQHMDVYLCKFDRENSTFDIKNGINSFDAAIEFQPLSRSLREFKMRKPSDPPRNLYPIPKYLNPKRYLKYIKKLLLANRRPDQKILYTKNDIVAYNDFVDFDLQSYKSNLNLKIYPGVSPGFDNSSRRQGGDWATIFHDSTPEAFKSWLKGKLKHFTPFSEDENFLFINAWNEWAEGNHLEPDEKWGLKYLEVLYECLKEDKVSD